jgi:hypothetical protein
MPIRERLLSAGGLDLENPLNNLDCALGHSEMEPSDRAAIDHDHPFLQFSSCLNATTILRDQEISSSVGEKISLQRVSMKQPPVLLRRAIQLFVSRLTNLLSFFISSKNVGVEPMFSGTKPRALKSQGNLSYKV